MKKVFKITWLCCLTCSVSFACFAQTGIGMGLVFSPSFYLDDDRGSGTMVGVNITATVRPRGSILYPSLNYQLLSHSLPLANEEYFKLEVTTTQHNFMLDINYPISGSRHYLVSYAGLGVSRIVPGSTLNAFGLNNINAYLRDEGGSKNYPSFRVGLKYLYELSVTPSIYAGADVYAQLVYIFETSGYTIVSGTREVPASIGGKLLVPVAMFSVHYLFNKRSD